jgi:hypothetical protein
MMAAAIPAAIATGSMATFAAAATDPIFAAIDTHRAAVAEYVAADREYGEALRLAVDTANSITRSTTAGDHYWHFYPDDLGGRLCAAPPTAKTYFGIVTHEVIDDLADAGAMMQGERERLHAALDANLRHKDWIDRLSVAADEAHEAKRRAMRDLLDVKPTTMAGASALANYLGR